MYCRAAGLPVTPDLALTLLFVLSWIKLRSAMLPHTILLEPLSECMLSGALASLSAHILFKIDPVPFYMVHILVWFMFDWILIHVVQVTTKQYKAGIVLWQYKCFINFKCKQEAPMNVTLGHTR